LDQARLRGPQRAGLVPATIDLGNEPPLSVDGATGVGVDRRRVSVQWFSGTILTGLCGAALMGGAVFASLDGETNFAVSADRLETAHEIAADADKNVSHKSDRLPALGEANLARQLIPISITTKVGNHEVMRKRTLVRVETNLSLSTSELSANLPPFNPQRMLADTASNGAADEPAAPEADDAVSFVTRDLAAILPRVRISETVPIEDVIARVRDAANWTGSVAQPSYLVASTQPNARLGYAAEGNDLYAPFGARGVPQNITLLQKTASQTTGGTGASERTVAAHKGDSVGTILRDLGATADDIKAITAALGAKGREGALKEGEKVRVLLSPLPGATPRMQPARVTLIGDTAVEAVIALSDMGKYVSVDVQSADTPVADNASDQDDDDGSGVRLYQSIYETALRNQVPRPVVDELIRIYSYDVDFQRKAEPGDSFSVLYSGEDEAGGVDAKNEIVFASLTVGGETKKFYRYQSPSDGLVDYYDETGKSAKKFLVRKPVAEGIMRSGFGMRNHPILGFVRAHTGVDWAAPNGTPIYASGNGTIEEVGPKNGYGKYIRIRHANGYETAYGHMSAFARNMTVGTHVHQGQIIGYVGSTGLATGPHLHYEILINGRFVDPMKVKLPRGRVLEGSELAAFDQERDHDDAIMAQSVSPTRTATR